jgi:predicted transposase/invertase (TIGR01784 family)
MEEILQSTYMDPLTDYGFKKLFGEVSNKELLIDFLNEIIKEEGCITDIKYQPTEQLGNTEDDRKAVFDIFCKNEKDEWIIVEMQKAKQTHFVDRSLFYSTFPIQRQAPKGQTWNFELKAVYTVALLNFRLFNEPDEEDFFIERIYLTRERTKARYSKKLNFIFVELPKFKKTIAKLETNVDRWLYCFKHLGQLEARPEELSGRVFVTLFKKAEINKLTDTEMEEYRKSVLEYADVRDCMDCARSEGRSEGIERGIERGIKQVAKNLLESHFPVNDIAKVTGLSPEQILQIQRV